MNTPKQVRIDGHLWELDQQNGWVYVNEDDPTWWTEALMLDHIAELEAALRGVLTADLGWVLIEAARNGDPDDVRDAAESLAELAGDDAM
jgi:hypothetical protein